MNFSILTTKELREFVFSTQIKRAQQDQQLCIAMIVFGSLGKLEKIEIFSISNLSVYLDLASTLPHLLHRTKSLARKEKVSEEMSFSGQRGTQGNFCLTPVGKVTDQLSTLTSLQMAERREVKSAKRSFASKIYIRNLWIRSFALLSHFQQNFT